MPRYYFDFRDGDRLSVDDEGLELSGKAAAQNEATQALATLARDTLPGATRRSLSIDVRDDAGLLLSVKMAFEVSVIHRA